MDGKTWCAWHETKAFTAVHLQTEDKARPALLECGYDLSAGLDLLGMD